MRRRCSLGLHAAEHQPDGGNEERSGDEQGDGLTRLVAAVRPLRPLAALATSAVAVVRPCAPILAAAVLSAGGGQG